MRTELEIIYSILNSLRDSEHNQDEKISERLLREYLKTYRPGILRKFYLSGAKVNDEVFQNVELSFSFNSDLNEYSSIFPKTIEFEDGQGFYLMKSGIEIPIKSSERYSLSKRNSIHRNRIFGKKEFNKITVYVPPVFNGAINSVSETQTLANLLRSENQDRVKMDYKAVLLHPDDDPNYDFEKDPYPFPGEMLDELKTVILRKEFGIMSQAKRDEVQNGRSDEIRYHENQNINGAG